MAVWSHARALLCAAVFAVAPAGAPPTTAPPVAPRMTLMRALDGTLDDFGVSVAPLRDGSLISGFTAVDPHHDDALLLRVDRQGRERWRHVVPAGGDGALWSVCALDDGGMVAAGWMRSPRGDLDALLLRADSLGTILWQHAYGTGCNERLWSLVALPDGFLAAGESADSLHSTGFVLRTDLEGRERFQRTPGEADVERMFAVQALPDGGYALAGLAGHGPRESAGYDAQITCYDGAGRRRWKRSWGGPGFDVAHDLRRLPDGRFVVVGYTDAGAGRGTDAFLLVVSANGEVGSESTYGSPRDDRAVHVAIRPGGGFAFVGYSRRGETDWDIAVRATDERGALVWEQFLGGPAPEVGRALAFGLDGELTVVGHSRSYGPHERIVLARIGALP